MTETGIKAFGTKFQRGDGGNPEVFQDIALVGDITPPGLEADSIDMTTHDSPHGYRQYVQGLKDGGEVSIELKFVPSEETHVLLLNDYEEGKNRKYRIVFPDENNTTWEFEAHITGFEPDAPVEDELTASVTLKVTGKPTLGVV